MIAATRTTRAARRTAGLTLLEVLVASALMALLFTSLFAIVWDNITKRDSIEQKMLPYSTGPAVMQRIVDDLTFVQLDAIKDDDGFRAELESVSGGDTTRLDFVTAVPSRDQVEIRDQLVRAQLNECGYRCRRSDLGDNMLVLYRREDLGVDDEPLEGGNYYKLCDRVRRFSIDFYEEDPGDPGSEDANGVTEWDAKKEKKLPWGCRITLALDGPPKRVDGIEEDAPQELVFTTFVAFRTRHDKTETPAAPGGR